MVAAAYAGGPAPAAPPVPPPHGEPTLVELLASADDDPHALTGEDRDRVLAYSREQADLTRAAVEEEWAQAVQGAQAGGYASVADGQAGAYEAALRAHGVHLTRAVAMNAVGRIQEAGADEEALTAAGAFAGNDWDERARLVDAARAAHTRAWKEAMAEEMPHRTFGSVAPAAKFGTGMTKARQKDFADAASFYPDGMIVDSDEKGLAMQVRLSSTRAHYCPVKSFNEKAKVPVFHDAHDIVGTLKGKKPSEGTGEAMQRALSWAGSSHSLSGPDSFSGVVATPENRAMLNDAVAAWAGSASIRKQFGAKPEVVEIGNRLFLTGGKTKTMTSGEVSAAELTTDGSTDTTVHELAHRMESSNRRIGAACRAFHARRTEGLQPTLYAKTGEEVEMATKDGFVDHYVGKDYPDSTNHTEVFSMGMESVAGGRFGGLSGHRRDITLSGMRRTNDERIDREHHALVLGLLSTVSADRDQG